MSTDKARFGRYRLTEELGTGGMAVVYRAVVDGPEGFARQVVLKRILPRLATNPKFVKMFLAEARLCALLHHPSIVQVHDLGEIGGDYFLAMEFVDGLDLASVLRAAADAAQPMPLGVACHVALALAEALAYAHALCGADGRPLEIVHRDVSPSNVMVTAQGGVKLLDFGIARVANHAREEHTRTGTLKGKISYMSPEQAEGNKAIDRRSDVFALGIVLSECLTGQRLFRGDDDLETLAQIRDCKVWPPSSVRPEVDADLDTVVLKMLGRTPESRFQTCDEVAAALQPLVHRLEGSAAGLKRYLQTLGATRQPQSGGATTPAKRSATPAGGGTVTGSHGEVLSPLSAPARDRRRTLAFAAATVLAAAAVATTILLLPSHPPAQPASPQPASAQPAPPQPASAQPAPAQPAPAQPASAQPAPAQPAPAKPASNSPSSSDSSEGTRFAPSVHLAVRGPRGASVIIDGHESGRVPLDLELPRAAGTRTITVTIEGRPPWSTRVGAEASHTVTASWPRKHRAPGEPELRDPFEP